MRYRKIDRILVGSDDSGDGLDEEIRAHLEMRVEALMAEGRSRDEARTEALRRFGDVELARRLILRSVRQQERKRRWMGGAEGLLQDVRLALRSLKGARAFSAMTVVILAGAIGLAALTFAVTDHVLLRPLPFHEPTRLVTLQSVGETGEPFNSVSMSNWADWLDRNTTLAATALWRADPLTVNLPNGDPLRAEGTEVIGDFWAALGARFLVGGPFSPPEASDQGSVVVLSERLWSRAFGGATDLQGAWLLLDGRRFAVTGVLASGQEFPEDADFWFPSGYRRGSGAMRNNLNFEAIGRLRPDVTIEQATADLSGIARGIRETDPEALYSYGVGVLSLQERIAGGARRTVSLLMSAVLLLLLVACANLAGLALARARRRRDDMEVRLALGAGRARLARQLLTEHALLAGAGGAAGLAAAWIAVRPMAQLLATRLPRAAEVTVDAPIVLFALLASAAAALISGAGPVLGVVGGRTLEGVRTARGGVRGGRGMPGFVMVASELALATALLIGGGLLVRSFFAAASRPLGYDPEDVVTIDVTLSSPAYADSRAGAEYWTRMLERLRAEPGVVAAGAGNSVPTGESGTSFIELEGGAQGDLGAGYRVVSDDYLAAMGMELVGGRAFSSTDFFGSERVGLVNRTLAERYWPGQPALGKRLKATSMEAYYHGGVAPWITVVGVVNDVRHFGFEEEPMPELFVLYRQVPDWTRVVTAVVRVAPDLGPSPDALGEAARGVDPALAVNTSTLSARVRALLGERRLTLTVLGTFAALALLLASLGVYALISFAAEERRRELAIRATLGASHRGILSLMLRDAGRVVAVGLLVGVSAGYVLTRLLGSFLLDVSTRDPLTYAAATLLLTGVGLAAALIPAWRASHADPLAALTP